jgi:hypothetical protein
MQGHRRRRETQRSPRKPHQPECYPTSMKRETERTVRGQHGGWPEPHARHSFASVASVFASRSVRVGHRLAPTSLRDKNL